MNTNLLASKALLCTLKTGAWRATKLHRAESLAENERHGTGDRAKVLIRLTDHTALNALGKLHSEARGSHYRLTLPSVDDGFRLLPCGREMEHSRTMQTYADKHTALVSDFLADYADESAQAPTRLNGLYDPAQWPSEDAVRGKFSFATRYLPVPEAGQWQDWLRETAEEGRTELRERVGAALRAMAGKLSVKDAVFRDSLVANLADIVSLAADLNLTDDPEIAALAAQSAELARADPQTLRDNAAVRAATAQRAAELCSMFKL